MKTKLKHSFRKRLTGAFLAASLIPLLLCSVLMVQLARLRMTSQAQDTAQSQAEALCGAVRAVDDTLLDAAAALGRSTLVSSALAEGRGESTRVYNEFFRATTLPREYSGLSLYDLSGRRLYFTRGGGEPSLSTNWGILYAAAHAGPGQTVFMASEDPEDMTSPLLQGAVLLRAEGRELGYLVMDIYYTDFPRIFQGTYGAQSDFLLLSPFFRPVYASQSSLNEQVVQTLRGQLLAGKAPSSGDYLYHIVQEPATGLFLVLRQGQVFPGNTLGQFYLVCASCALVCVAASVILSLTLSRQISSPVGKLQEAIALVERDDLNVQVSPTDQDELGQLAMEFNRMVEALKHNRRELVENQRELNQAQIRMLQAQLNPHFLCNTLDTMKWISKINHVPQVAVMSTNLADILRFCISPEEFVPLSREMAVVERYMEIQRIRLSDGIRFTAELPPELEDCSVPKMILQPIVENAVLHGLDGRKDGFVRVEARLAEGGMLHITVTDNGTGLPPDMAGQFYRPRRPRNHLGLYNVSTILEKNYGEGSGIFLDNGPGGVGTAVTAILPARKCKKEDEECSRS